MLMTGILSLCSWIYGSHWQWFLQRWCLKRLVSTLNSQRIAHTDDDVMLERNPSRHYSQNSNISLTTELNTELASGGDCEVICTCPVHEISPQNASFHAGSLQPYLARTTLVSLTLTGAGPGKIPSWHQCPGVRSGKRLKEIFMSFRNGIKMQ